MAKGKKEKPKKPPRPARIGPFGVGTEVSWSDHGGDRVVQRLGRLGMDDAAVLSALLDPVGKWKDDWDPDYPNERVRRWSLVEAADGSMHRLRFVFRILRERTPEQAGSIYLGRDRRRRGQFQWLGPHPDP